MRSDKKDCISKHTHNVEAECLVVDKALDSVASEDCLSLLFETRRLLYELLVDLLDRKNRPVSFAKEMKDLLIV